MRFLPLILALSLEAVAALAASQPAVSKVSLRERIEINRESIRLSDLLPPDAPVALIAASNPIEVGPAPLPGSPRVLLAPQLITKLADRPDLLSELVLPATITVTRKGWPIPLQSIRSAAASYMQKRGWPQAGLLARADIAWPAVIALAENPAFEVSGAFWDYRQHLLQLRVRCLKRLACASFLVMTQFPGSLVERQIVFTPPATTSPHPPLQSLEASQPASGNPLTHAGDPASLILESNGIRISLPVVCLQRGFLRQEIRVRDAAGPRVYRAEVVGMDLLRAPL